MKAQVLLPKIFNFSFTYNSNNIALKTGDLVEVPFGKNKEIGVIWKNKSTELIFRKLHNKSWEENHLIEKKFNFLKMKQKIQNFNFSHKYDIIYYDAFGSRVQPELWTEDFFVPIIRSLNKNGVFVTYSSMGNLRRSLIKSGMKVEKIDGPIGKKEMIRAIKL